MFLILAVVQTTPDQNLFFVDRPGGIGKSLQLEQVLAALRSQEKLAVTVASCGIAAILRICRQFAHSTFTMSLRETTGFFNSIFEQSYHTVLLRATNLQ